MAMMLPPEEVDGWWRREVGRHLFLPCQSLPATCCGRFFTCCARGRKHFHCLLYSPPSHLPSSFVTTETLKSAQCVINACCVCCMYHAANARAVCLRLLAHSNSKSPPTPSRRKSRADRTAIVLYFYWPLQALALGWNLSAKRRLC